MRITAVFGWASIYATINSIISVILSTICLVRHNRQLEVLPINSAGCAFSFKPKVENWEQSGQSRVVVNLSSLFSGIGERARSSVRCIQVRSVWVTKVLKGTVENIALVSCITEALRTCHS